MKSLGTKGETLCWISVRDGMEDSDALGGSRERGGEVMFIRGRLHQSDAVCCAYIYCFLFNTPCSIIHTVSLYSSMSVLVNTNIVCPCITRT